MKLFKTIILSFLCLSSLNLSAQTQEVTQLVLNIEKLAQFKTILMQMKAGYLNVEKQYSHINDIEQRTFMLHRNYLEDLLQVHEPIREYQGVTDCLTMQKHLASTYHHLQKTLVSNPLLADGERSYVQSHVSSIIQYSLHNMDDLIAILSPEVYRMSDAERIKAIDRIYKTLYNQLHALSSIDQQLQQLLTYRRRSYRDKNQENKLLSTR